MKIILVETNYQIKKVESLGREIWTKHYTPIIGSSQVDYMLDKFQSTEAISKQLSEGYEYYLIDHNDRSVGYLSLQKREDSLFLSKFYIHERERGKGYGKKSLGFVYERANLLNCRSITLTVNKYNSNSIAAYKKMGFEIIEEAIFDIGQGYIMDDYIMKKVL